MAGRGTKRVIASELDDQPAQRTGRHEQWPGSPGIPTVFERLASGACHNANACWCCLPIAAGQRQAARATRPRADSATLRALGRN
jgi:hypothetical protein